MRDVTTCAALALLAVGCRNEPLPAVKAPGPEAVSLEQVISTPERFDVVLVRSPAGYVRAPPLGNRIRKRIHDLSAVTGRRHG
jgi:hypothetical protein